MLQKAKALAASFLIAVTIYFGIATDKYGKDAEDSEDTRPGYALAQSNEAYSAITAEANKRKFKRSYDALRAQGLAQVREQAEAKRQQALKAERERLAVVAEAKKKKARQAELKRQQAQAKPKATKQLASRSQPYVGRAQTYEATFYTAFCPTGCTGVTASGYNVSNTIYYEGRRILAAPKSIPLYSLMRVTLADGSSFDGIVLDRGGDIGNGRLDILVGSRDEAYANGRQRVTAQLLRRGR